MTFPRCRAGLLVAVLAGAWGCDYNADEAPQDPYIHILVAAQQPQSSDLGVIVYIQCSGGNYVSLLVQSGTMRLGSSDGGAPAEGACIPVSAGDGAAPLIPIVVFPTSSEALVSASLYDAGTSLDNANRGASCATNLPAVASDIKPVEHVSNLTGMTDAESDADAGRPDGATSDAGPPDAKTIEGGDGAASDAKTEGG